MIVRVCKSLDMKGWGPIRVLPIEKSEYRKDPTEFLVLSIVSLILELNLVGYFRDVTRRPLSYISHHWNLQVFRSSSYSYPVAISVGVVYSLSANLIRMKSANESLTVSLQVRNEKQRCSLVGNLCAILRREDTHVQTCFSSGRLPQSLWEIPHEMPAFLC